MPGSSPAWAGQGPGGMWHVCGCVPTPHACMSVGTSVCARPRARIGVHVWGGRERIKVLPACFRHARLPLSSDILRGGECGSDHRLQGQDWGPGFCGKLVSLGEGWNFQRSRWEWVPVDSQQGHGAEAGTGHEACGADAGDAFSAVGHAEGTAGESPILVSRTMRNRPPSLGFPYGSPS